MHQQVAVEIDIWTNEPVAAAHPSRDRTLQNIVSHYLLLHV
jgi:hypothetical protein